MMPASLSTRTAALLALFGVSFSVIGLIFTRLLDLAGANVLAADFMDTRLKAARQMGAKWTVLSPQRVACATGPSGRATSPAELAKACVAKSAGCPLQSFGASRQS